MPVFNETFPVFESEYDSIFIGYKVELIGLASLISAKKKSEYLSRISDYDGFKKLVLDKRYKKKINKVLKKSPIVNVGHQSEIITDVLFTSHLAICCDLLDGVKIPLEGLMHANIDTTVQALLGQYKNIKQGSVALQNLNSKLHSIDAFRTVQILKALGLYTIESENITQLSLGVGPGTKDLKSVHLQPKIKILPDNAIEFSVSQLHAKDVILVDGDPSREDLFNTLNDNQEYPIIAINDNTSDALLKIPDILKERKLALRNTVIALRIDHRMIPDVGEFFRSLISSIDEISYLIVTIGSGFDINDYKGRTSVIKNMYDYLKRIGLCPVLLKLHAKGTLEEQWNDHAFGLKSITTYEILYCRLKKNILLKNMVNN